ncbi:MAG TPA: hypothetical protein VK988_10855 [Acidimicrobiales bacterium]|nr:hypothetical protein [Acidimicrobiales bacterium]
MHGDQMEVTTTPARRRLGGKERAGHHHQGVGQPLGATVGACG